MKNFRKKKYIITGIIGISFILPISVISCATTSNSSQTNEQTKLDDYFQNKNNLNLIINSKYNAKKNEDILKGIKETLKLKAKFSQKVLDQILLKKQNKIILNNTSYTKMTFFIGSNEYDFNLKIM